MFAVSDIFARGLECGDDTALGNTLVLMLQGELWVPGSETDIPAMTGLLDDLKGCVSERAPL